MIYDTQVVERWEQHRFEGQRTENRAESFFISQTEKTSLRMRGEVINYSQTEGRKTI